VSQLDGKYLTFDGTQEFQMHPCVCCLFICGRHLSGGMRGGVDMDEGESAADCAKAAHRETFSQVLPLCHTLMGKCFR